MLPLVLVLAGLIWNPVAGDLPVNCTLEDVLGDWIIYEGPVSEGPDIDCTSMPMVNRKIRFSLKEGLAYRDGTPNGIWTMIYNEGFELSIDFRTYFSFLKYRSEGNGIYTSICNETAIGKSHDVTLRHWACFYARKQGSFSEKRHQDPFQHPRILKETVPLDEEHAALVKEVNRVQSSWKAELNADFLGKSHDELLKLRGGKRSWLPARPPKANISVAHTNDEGEYDWRNVFGVNFVSPVRNQGRCGSCYAFSSVGMIESRLRVATGNGMRPLLSPQDIVSCTTLAQGCDGGFPYLIAGKYGWEKGLTDESCFPYTGHDGACTEHKCQRWYTATYQYVGGYYGACNEQNMIEALSHGPFSVSFEVYPDFMHYKSGIYHYTGVKAFEPFVVVNHAVLLVGYGTDKATNEKYWIVKNSWGESWGENGYFRIRRGVDECGIESIGVQAFPIPY